MYSDAKVKTQFAANIHVVSVRVRAEYRITTVNRRDLTSTVVGPLPASYVSRLSISVSVEHAVKPSGELGTVNRAISTDRLETGLIANANAWNV